MIEESPPIHDLLQRADEAIARQDWKLAVDSLQRVIDEPGGALLARKERVRGGAQLYESVRRIALQTVAVLPPEGLQAYRLLLDGKAKGLYERAKADHDTDALRRVVRQYLLTRWGDDAADTLASWALDEGRPVEAALVLRNVFEWCHDRDVPESRLVGKLASAYGMMGLDTDATVEINNYRARLADADRFEEWLAEVPTATSLRRTAAFSESTASHGLPADEVLSTERPFRPTIERGPLWSGVVEAGSQSWAADVDPPSHAVRHLMYPGGALAAAADALIIRTPAGCAAARLDDLQPLWRQPAQSTDTQRELRWDAIGRRFTYDVLFPRSTVVQDYIAAAVSVVGDVALAVERHRLGLDDPDLTPQMRGFNIGRPGREEPLARLFAYDPLDGSVRWSRGRGGAADDPLTGADFRAMPIDVRGELWVPYYRQNDLYLGVLDPADGKLLRELLLCSIGGAWDVPGHEIRPTYADGLVFAPTGHGLLLAIDATEFSPIWATGYHYLPVAGERGALSSEPGMVSSAPVVAGGVVILAAWDAPHLMAFDVMSGQVRWTAPLDGAAYVLGADAEHVWFGGTRVRCLRARDGAEKWRYDTADASVSGRAVICRNLVLVPTPAGLLNLSRDTGALLDEQALPAGELPLGQILCRGDALYSLDEEGIRLFPDADAMYERAREHFEESGRTVDGLQVVRLNLFQDRPQEALRVLDQVRNAQDSLSTGYADSLRRVQVQAALALAEDGATSTSRAIDVLRDARAHADRLDDRLNVGLALAERLDAHGSAGEAAQLLWDMGVGPEGIGTVENEPGILSQGWLLVARRLAEILPRLNEPDRAKLDELVAQRVETWSAEARAAKWSGPVDRLLLAVAELGVTAESSDHARLTLAEVAARRLRFESAEQHLQACARRCETPQARLAARLLLVDLYTNPSLPLPQAAEREMQLLERDASSEPLPIALLRGADERFDADATPTVGAWMASVRQKIGAPTVPPSDPSAANPTVVQLAAEGRHAWMQYPMLNGSAPRVLRLGVTPAGLDDRVVVVLASDQLQGKDAITGRDLWRTTLSSPQSFPQVETQSAMRTPTKIPPPSFGAVDGQTAVVASSESGLFAIGLASGKQLWHRPFTRVPRTFAGELPVNPAAEGGDVLVALSPRHVGLVRACDGSSRWEVRLTDVEAGELWLTPDRALVANMEREQVAILDRMTGRRVAKVRFRQPDPDGELVRLVRSGDHLFGPDDQPNAAGLKAVDVRTGATAWRRDLPQKLVQLFEASPGFLGVGVLGTEFLLIDAPEGELLRTLSVPGGRAVRDGVLVNGTLVLQQVVTRNDLRYPRLQAVDLVTGEELWSRESMAPASWADLMFVVAGRSVFTVLEDQPIEPSARQRVSPARKLMVVGLDVASGQPVGPSIDLPHANVSTRLTGDFLVLPGALVVGTDAGVYGFRTIATTPGAAPPDGGS